MHIGSAKRGVSHRIVWAFASAAVIAATPVANAQSTPVPAGERTTSSPPAEGAPQATATAQSEEASQKQLCADKHGESQVLRKKGKLKAAREALLICAREHCPAMVSGDCTDWLNELLKDLPSVVVSAESDRGEERDVTVFVDNLQVMSRLEGRPLDIDPGEHVLRFELKGHAAKEQTLLIREGEKRRMIPVSFRTKPPPEAMAARRADTGLRPPSLPVYVLGGVALAGAGVFTGVGLWGSSQRTNLLQDCAPGCSSSQAQSVETKFLVADIALGTAVVAAAAAVVVYVLDQKKARRETHAITSGHKRAAPANVLGGRF